MMNPEYCKCRNPEGEKESHTWGHLKKGSCEDLANNPFNINPTDVLASWENVISKEESQ